MRIHWMMSLVAAAMLSQTSVQSPPLEQILARRLEQKTQFSQRMGRGGISEQQRQILKWIATKGNSHVKN